MSQQQNNSLTELIEKINQHPSQIEFEQVMKVIKDHYHFQPTSFSNADLLNEKGCNEGSCKLFYFAKLHQLTEQQTLYCFGRFYREDVLQNPTAKDHGNIRRFMKTGWQGIKFESVALVSLP